MTKPAHHGKQTNLPQFQEGVSATLNTPNGVYVVRMMPGRRIDPPYHWSILSQPEGSSASTTGPRPSYSDEVRLISENEYPTYNEYHRAINYLEDRLYAEQQQRA